MKTTISILVVKIVTFICKLFKRNGTVFPGECVKKINKHPLDDVIFPDKVVVVTGSSGKGSSVNMIAHILEKNGKKVVWNKSGSNVANAIITLILQNTSMFTHKVDADVVLIEMDERYLDTFKKGTITHLALTNITRDQPARNIHPDIIYNKIFENIDNMMHLIINIDDPILNRIKYVHPGKITTYGIAKTKYDTSSVSYAVDAAYCPSCHSKLKYSSYHYGHLGIYECMRCSFKRGKVDYEATDVDLKKGTFKIGKDKVKLDKNVFFAIYYTILAYVVCDLLKLDKKDILREINDDSISSKRGKIYSLKGRKIEMLESKNENALSYLQSLNYIKDQEGKKSIIMGFENVSRRYKYNDLSWLWDVNFELLNDKNIDKIYCIGRFKYDLKTRLDYANIKEDKIVLIDDLEELLDTILSTSTGDIYTMVCFDMTEVITKMLKERHDEESN